MSNTLGLEVVGQHDLERLYKDTSAWLVAPNTAEDIALASSPDTHEGIPITSEPAYRTYWFWGSIIATLLPDAVASLQIDRGFQLDWMAPSYNPSKNGHFLDYEEGFVSFSIERAATAAYPYGSLFIIAPGPEVPHWQTGRYQVPQDEYDESVPEVLPTQEESLRDLEELRKEWEIEALEAQLNGEPDPSDDPALKLQQEEYVALRAIVNNLDGLRDLQEQV